VHIAAVSNNPFHLFNILSLNANNKFFCVHWLFALSLTHNSRALSLSQLSLTHTRTVLSLIHRLSNTLATYTQFSLSLTLALSLTYTVLSLTHTQHIQSFLSLWLSSHSLPHTHSSRSLSHTHTSHWLTDRDTRSVFSLYTHAILSLSDSHCATRTVSSLSHTQFVHDNHTSNARLAHSVSHSLVKY